MGDEEGEVEGPYLTVLLCLQALLASRCYIKPTSLMGVFIVLQDSHWVLPNIIFLMSSILFLPALDISPYICFQKLSLLASCDLLGNNLN